MGSIIYLDMQCPLCATIVHTTGDDLKRFEPSLKTHLEAYDRLREDDEEPMSVIRESYFDLNIEEMREVGNLRNFLKEEMSQKRLAVCPECNNVIGIMTLCV